MRYVKLTLAYDGSAYAGWQVQPGQRTIQGVMETALAEIVGRSVRTMASGRTDAGVHALGQVVGFRADTDLEPESLQRALNARLPCDIAVLEALGLDGPFHPVRDAVRKRYRYVIHDSPVRNVFARHYAWHVRARLDAAAMGTAAKCLVGTHDFSSFESAGAPRPDSVRTIFALPVFRGQGDGRNVVTIEIEADGFLYNMVRAIVGTLVEVGRGARPPVWVGEVLASRDRGRAGPTAPPHGLFLVKVEYRTMP
jgi:tRNA pseudouridine38-40 synthase